VAKSRIEQLIKAAKQEPTVEASIHSMLGNFRDILAELRVDVKGQGVSTAALDQMIDELPKHQDAIVEAINYVPGDHDDEDEGEEDGEQSSNHIPSDKQSSDPNAPKAEEQKPVVTEPGNKLPPGVQATGNPSGTVVATNPPGPVEATPPDPNVKPTLEHPNNPHVRGGFDPLKSSPLPATEPADPKTPKHEPLPPGAVVPGSIVATNPPGGPSNPPVDKTDKNNIVK